VFGDVALDLVCADSSTFTPAAPCPLICEHTFPCILPRKLRADWGRRVTKLLPPGGLLAGYLFLGDQLKGPPLGIVPGQLDELLGPNFGRIEDAAGRLDPAIFRPRALGGGSDCDFKTVVPNSATACNCSRKYSCQSDIFGSSSFAGEAKGALNSLRQPLPR